MKLAKLIPFATITSIVAIITPLATSCGTGGYTLNLKDVKDYKLVDQKTGSMKESEATAIYLNEISKNNKIYADDLFYPYIESSFDPVPDTLVSTITVKNIKVDVAKSTLSAVFVQYEKGFETITDGDGNTYKDESDINLTYEITNMKFEVYYDTDEHAWRFETKYDSESEWKTDENWTASIKGHSYENIDGEEIMHEDYNYSYNCKNVEFSIVGLIGTQFEIPSCHYFAKVSKE